MAAVFLEHGDNARAVAGDDLAGIVGRAVVDDNHFGVRVSLAQGAINGFAEEAAIVEVVDEDADEGARRAHALVLERRICA